MVLSRQKNRKRLMKSLTVQPLTVYHSINGAKWQKKISLVVYEILTIVNTEDDMQFQ